MSCELFLSVSVTQKSLQIPQAALPPLFVASADLRIRGQLVGEDELSSFVAVDELHGDDAVDHLEIGAAPGEHQARRRNDLSIVTELNMPTAVRIAHVELVSSADFEVGRDPGGPPRAWKEPAGHEIGPCPCREDALA